ncbi:MAG: M24 family metallopeptidase, partial [Alphaproteobacteria bacterium]
MELKTHLRDEIDWELPFPPEEYALRRKRVRVAMAKAGVDVLMLCRFPDMNWLTGYDMILNHLRNPATLVVRADSDDTLFFDAAAHTTIVSLVPEIRDVVFFDHGPMAEPADFSIMADELDARGLAGGTIGLQFWGWGPHPSVVEALAERLRAKGANVVDASLLVETQRLYKSPREQEVMRQAATMGDNALDAARAAMVPGMRETEIEAVMTASLMEQGCNYPTIHTMVGSGVRSGTHHSAPTHRR